MALASRSSRILALVALAAVAFYAFVELPRRRAEQRAESSASRLTSLDPARVDRVVLTRPGDTVDLAVRGAHWVLLSPVADVAEVSSVTQVLATIQSARVGRDLGASGDLSRYGLDPPDVTVAIIASSDTLFCVDVGTHTVDAAAVYARRRDGHVVLISPDVREAATRPADDYRSRRVATFDLSVVHAYTLRSRDGETRWQRGNGDHWFTVVHGDSVRGDSIAIPGVLRQLRGMRVRSFVSTPDTSGRFDDPLVSLRVERTDAPPLHVRFAVSGTGAVWARVDGEDRVVEVDGDARSLAAQTVATLRDRRLLQFAPHRALRITIATPDTSGVLVRAGDRWALPNPALGPIGPERAADFVRALLALRYQTRLPASTGVAREPDAFSLVVYGEGDTILDELHVAAPRGTAPGAVAFSRSAGGPCEVAVADLRAVVASLRRLRPGPVR